MLITVRSWNRSNLIAGVLACVIAMLVAMPVLRVQAAGSNCHDARLADAVLPVEPHSHDTGHEHPPVMDHGADAAVGSATAASQQTSADDKPAHQNSGLQLSCCLPGCGLAVLPSPIPQAGVATVTNAQRFPATTNRNGLDPSAPRKPPRTTYIVDQAA